MTDIDFDELDKAVNSLMGTVPKDEPDEAPKAKLLNISSTLKPGEKPAYNKLVEVAKQIGSETLVTDGERTVIEELDSDDDASANPSPVAEQPIALPQENTEPVVPVSVPSPEPTPTIVDTPPVSAPPASVPEEVPATPIVPAAPLMKRPNSGRFMDVVHSSSDMKSSDFPPLVVPERIVPKPVAPPVTVSSVPKEKVQESVPEAPITFDTPIDAILAEPAPLTPFLPDAKVEKRPLGGVTESVGAVPSPFTNEELADADSNKNEEPIVSTVTNGVHESGLSDGVGPSDTQKSLNATDFSFKQTVDEEAVRAIESHETNAGESMDEVPIVPQGSTPEEHVRVVESADTESLSTGAIGRQYTQQTVESSDSEDSAIYDVDDYHQPLSHPARQKSGWGIVTIIALIVIICSGLVAAAYFMLGTGA